LKAFAALDEKGRNVLHQDLGQLWSDHNQSNNGITQVESEYLEITARR
jgi:hypothetical protein